MAVISEGQGAGFHLCGWCGWAEAFTGKPMKGGHQRPTTGLACEGKPQIVSLAHRYETDVAEFTFGGVSYAKESESRWLSVLYALLEGASEALEISRDDIDGTLSWSGDGKRSIVLFDTVPGGAGAAKKIAESLAMVIQFAVDRVSRCDCGEETSCYGCLRSYRNDRHHDRLTREGALAIFQQLNVVGATSAGGACVDRPWGVTLVHTPESVVELLVELELRGVAKPDIGVDLGKHYWPVEAVWPEARVVLVDGEDTDRDGGLGDEGFTVVRAGDVEFSELVGILV